MVYYNRKLTKPQIKTEYLITLYEEGMATTEIEQMVEMSAQGIWARLKNAGVKIRGHSEAVKLAGERGRKLQQTGELNCRWKGGRSIDKQGYIQLIINRKSYPEHRKIWEDHNGVIPEGYIIHHLNGIRTDNRIENLIALSRQRHSPITIIEPYRKRILELEKELKNRK